VVFVDFDLGFPHRQAVSMKSSMAWAADAQIYTVLAFPSNIHFSLQHYGHSVSIVLSYSSSSLINTVSQRRISSSLQKTLKEGYNHKTKSFRRTE
jgi:hypothetical protein